MIHLVKALVAQFERIPYWLIALLGRFSIAAVFWKSGQTKVEGFVVDIVSGEFQFGLPKLADDRAFSMSNVSQLATQEWLDTVMKVMEANKGASRQKIITLLEDAYAGMPAAGAEKLDWHDLIDKPKEN